ncbi:MAG: ATP-binding cassette domain-containing protein [Candidatus Tisiphia sp.]
MIILDKVSRNYGKTFAVKDISFEFQEKGTIAIIGSSGSGKSTLL